VNFATAVVGALSLPAVMGWITDEVYEEELGLCRQLPCSVPNDGQLYIMGSALLSMLMCGMERSCT
jgi:hypothetical protein